MASDPPVLVEAMSNKQLKELISKAGLPTADLFEEKDLRARAHEAAAALWLNRRQAPPPRSLVERSMRPAAAMPEDMPDDDWIVVHKLGLSKQEDGDFAAAEALLRRALALVEKQLPDSPCHVMALQSLARLLAHKLGAFVAAEPLFRKVLAIRENQPNGKLTHVTATLNNLAECLHVKRDFAAAEPLLRRALAIREKQLEPDHLDVAASMSSLAHLLKAKGDFAAAEPLFQRALPIFEKHYHPKQALRVGSVKTALLEIKRAREQDGAAAAVAPPAPKRQKRPRREKRRTAKRLATGGVARGEGRADAYARGGDADGSEESDGATEDDCVITGSRSAEERDAELLRNAISIAEDSDAEADVPKALGEGAQPTGAGTLEDQLAKLRDGLEGDGFDVSVALTWCEENGADKLYEIVEAKMVDEFVASLALKPVKAKVLKERLRAFVAAGG